MTVVEYDGTRDSSYCSVCKYYCECVVCPAYCGYDGLVTGPRVRGMKGGGGPGGGGTMGQIGRSDHINLLQSQEWAEQSRL